ncbi:MAG: AraC family transcriptional regulator [Verrucomicrobiota bacterium]
MSDISVPDRATVAAQSALALLELLDHTDGIQYWVKDRSGVIQWANTALLFQYSETGDPSAVLGKTDYDLSPKDLAEQFRLDDNRVLAGTPVINREEVVTGADHLAMTVLTTKLPVYDASGAIIGTVGMCRPRTQKSAALLESGMAKVLAYIREHYTEKPENSLLALLLGQPEDELERLFITHLKMRPQEYLRRVRVRLACHDLVKANMSFDEISTKHGFEDHDTFVKEFQEETGSTPRAYRLNLFQQGAVRI